jgi:hypothetical protein
MHYSVITGLKNSLFVLLETGQTSQASAMHRLVSFWSDYSRAVVPLFLVPYCFLGSRVLPREGAQVLEGDLTW